VAVRVPKVRSRTEEPVISRLKLKWQGEHRRWCERRLDADRWVYLWVGLPQIGRRSEITRAGMTCSSIVPAVR